MNPVSDPFKNSSSALMPGLALNEQTNESDDIQAAFDTDSTIAETPVAPTQEFQLKPWMKKYDNYNANRLQLEYNKLYNSGRPLGFEDKSRKAQMENLIDFKRSESKKAYNKREDERRAEASNPFANPGYRDLSGFSTGRQQYRRGDTNQYMHGMGHGFAGMGDTGGGGNEYRQDTGYKDSMYYTGGNGGFDFSTQQAASGMYGDEIGNNSFGRQLNNTTNNNMGMQFAENSVLGQNIGMLRGNSIDQLYS